MPEVSLKAYFARLNSLLSVNSADEVIHHARHILQTYPKNVTAYRFLGRALVLNGRWEEGREALRRVLSVYPDDYIAHLGLSEANEHLNHPDEAIWHLERAYEQSPNNKDIIDALRGLYRRYRNVENQKMPLTSAAVARQYARSGAYDQAIDTLRSARARMNDRLDLKLLLGQLLWDHGTQQGAQEEAGEIALDVLKVLPDCLEANRIMAKLWLSHGLPSEAQRFVNHLEAVDPYLAVEVVQGSAPDDDVFRLDELDYVRTSASEMASARPDWLQEISNSPAPVLEAEAGAEAGNNGEDWANWTSVLLGNQNPPAATPPAEVQVSSRFSRFVEDDDEEDELPAYVPPNTGGLTDLFGQPGEAAAEELAELFGGSGDDNFDDDVRDPMAWMRDAGIEILDEEDEQPSFDDLFAEEANSSSPMPDAVASPMAWLEQSNSDLILEPEAADDDSEFGDENDFSWMRDDVFGEDTVQPADRLAEEPQVEQQEEETYEAFDWAQADQLLDEALSLEGHLTGDFGAARSEREAAAAFDAETPDEQDDLDDLWGAAETPAAETDLPSFEDTPASESGVPGPRRGLTAILQEANFDWQQPAEQTGSLDDFGDEWMNQFGPAEPRKALTDAPDWLTDLQPETAGEHEDDEWFKPEESERLASGSTLADVENFAQMSVEEPPPDEEDSDWLAEFAPEEDEEPASDAVSNAPDAAGDDGDTGALPDWLTEVAPQAEVEDTMSNADPEADYTWMNDDDEQSSAEPDDAPAAAGDVPDWLAEMKPEEADDDAVADDADADDEPEDFSWMNDAALTQAESAVNASAAVGAIDWLSELGDEEEKEPQAAVGHEEDEYTWMNDDEQPAAEADAEPAAAGDVPDWLAELNPEAEADDAEPIPEAEPVSEAEDYSWMSSLEDETELAMDTISPADAPEALETAAESDLDWLSELEDEAEEEPVAEHEIAEADLTEAANPEEDYTWMQEEPVSESKPEGVNEFSVPPLPIPADDIDWMSELQAESETDAGEPEAEPAAEAANPDDDYTWMTALTAENETVTPAGEIDWTSELATGNEEEDYTWMRDEPESEANEVSAAVASDDLDWLSELESDSEQADAEDEPVAQPETSDEDLSWMAADDVDEDAEAVASDVPDWLAESAPAEPAPAAQADEELTWLAADDEDELEPEAASEDETLEAEPMAEADAEAESTLPDWLRDAMPAAAAATVAASTFDDAEEIEENEDQFAASLEDDDVLEPTPASNAPDWLNAMVPGLDVDYDAPEDEWTEEDDRASFGADEREYAWVEQMVEEELAQVEAPAFSFTRPPTWFASLGQGGGGAGDGEDDFPDWVSDDGEADLPDYLR